MAQSSVARIPLDDAFRCEFIGDSNWVFRAFGSCGCSCSCSGRHVEFLWETMEMFDVSVLAQGDQIAQEGLEQSCSTLYNATL